MKITREITNVIRYILDNIIPPFLRDQKWFMWLPFKLLFKNKAELFFNFKEDIIAMSSSQIAEVYKQTIHVHISRETDLNKACINKILNDIRGYNVLDVGCGSGFLFNLLEENNTVTGVDFVKSESFKTISDSSLFVQADATKLPFENDCFDVVICSHTLEHIKDIHSAVIELKRVCKHKLIVIVPQQRPYKYSFDLHVHFFPYSYVLSGLFAGVGAKKFKHQIHEIFGDLYYQEEYIVSQPIYISNKSKPYLK